MTSVSFKCKAAGCDQEVTYLPDIIPVLASSRDKVEPEDDEVYLTCDKGHQFSYLISSKSKKEGEHGGAKD